MISEHPNEGENVYSWMLRRFHDEEKVGRIEWCKTHNKACERCYKYPCFKDEESIKEGVS